MKQVGRPERVDSGGELGRRPAEAGEAQVVVTEIPTRVAIGRAVALVQVGRDEDVDAEAVRRGAEGQFAGRYAGEGTEPGDRRQGLETGEHPRIAGDEDPDVVVAAQRPGQGARHLAEAAGLQTIPHGGANSVFGQHFALAMPESLMAEFWLGSDPGVPLEEMVVLPGTAVIKDGYLKPSDAPGFGIEITKDWLEAAAV